MNVKELSDLATDVSDPRAGLRAVVSLRALADALELRQVEAALEAGMTWQAVADALGVSRQAVHKKYSRRIDQRLVKGRGR